MLESLVNSQILNLYLYQQVPHNTVSDSANHFVANGGHWSPGETKKVDPSRLKFTHHGTRISGSQTGGGEALLMFMNYNSH